MKRKIGHRKGNLPIFSGILYRKSHGIGPLCRKGLARPREDAAMPLPSARLGAGGGGGVGRAGEGALKGRSAERTITAGPGPLVTNSNSLAGFAGCDLRHGPDRRRQEPGGRTVLGLPGQPLQHRHCTSGQPDERLSDAPLSGEGLWPPEAPGCGAGRAGSVSGLAPRSSERGGTDAGGSVLGTAFLPRTACCGFNVKTLQGSIS